MMRAITAITTVIATRVTGTTGIRIRVLLRAAACPGTESLPLGTITDRAAASASISAWGRATSTAQPYAGRVYGYSGYSAPGVYGSPVYYGDIRLQVQPRDAQVYVDGYYSGIVDDFDGVFQRLTLEVGPHQIELVAPGLDSRVFEVYVDPARTVTIRADLFR